MGSTLRKLTLFCPTANETALINCLDSMAPLHPMYIYTQAQARGTAVDLDTMREKVYGAMQTSVFTMVIPESEVEAILIAAKLSCSKAHLSYWLETAEDYGVLK